MARKGTGLVGTVVFHLGLLVFIIIFGFATPLPLPGEEGILINFGTDDQGAGEDEPMMSQIQEMILKQEFMEMEMDFLLEMIDITV